MTTAIEWCDVTWNPVVGCSRVSRGCDNCYAIGVAARNLCTQHKGLTKIRPRDAPRPGPDWTGEIRLVPQRLTEPLGWRKPRRVFVNSMSDLFHKKVPRSYVDQVFDAMEGANWHVYQVLTKRSSLMRSYIQRRYDGGEVPSHIWLGVSVEDAVHTSRIRHLQQVNSPARFISFEPLLGPVGPVELSGIAWAIVGGESGPRARPMEADWAREIRLACEHHGTAFFFKQWGGPRPKSGGRVLDGEEWNGFPLHVVPERILAEIA